MQKLRCSLEYNFGRRSYQSASAVWSTDTGDSVQFSDNRQVDQRIDEISYWETGIDVCVRLLLGILKQFYSVEN